MPYSCDIYYNLYKDHLRTFNPKKILDIGPGAGTYGKLSREVFSKNVKIDAVEPTAEYVEKFKLETIYDNVHNLTIQDYLLNSAENEYDLAVCGDVLEHLFLHEAMSVIDCLFYRCNTIIMAWPTNLKQNSVNVDNREIFNNYENHKCNILLNDLTRFDVLFYIKNKTPYLGDNVFYHYAVLSKK